MEASAAALPLAGRLTARRQPPTPAAGRPATGGSLSGVRGTGGRGILIPLQVTPT